MPATRFLSFLAHRRRVAGNRSTQHDSIRRASQRTCIRTRTHTCTHAQSHRNANHPVPRHTHPRARILNTREKAHSLTAPRSPRIAHTPECQPPDPPCSRTADTSLAQKARQGFHIPRVHNTLFFSWRLLLSLRLLASLNHFQVFSNRFFPLPLLQFDWNAFFEDI